MSDTDKSIKRARNTLSQRKSRAKKKEAKALEGNSERNDEEHEQVQFSPPSALFSTKQAMGKAKKKVAKALPLSPRKKVAIIALFSEEYSEMLKTHTKPKRIHGKSLSSETEEKVIQFYENNEVSWHL